MARAQTKFRLDPRCHSILESVRDENLLPSLNAALNFLLRDYRRLQDEARLARNHSGTTMAPKVAAAKAT
jgi:hypothetical protein